MARTEGVNSVGRAIDILRALAAGDEAMTLSEVADISNLPRSTVHRIVQSLLETNFIVADKPGGGLRLGPELARLAAVSGNRLTSIVRPHLYRLSNAIDEGVSLSVLEGASVRFLDQVITTHGLRAFSIVGSTMAAHSTANGKALLSRLPARSLRAVLPPTLPALTENTITDRAVLIEHLAITRDTGVAFDLEENDMGICGIGGVVQDAVGNLAAISIAVPTQRFVGLEGQLKKALESAVADIDHELIYSPTN